MSCWPVLEVLDKRGLRMINGFEVAKMWSTQIFIFGSEIYFG